MKQFDVYTDGSHLDKQNNGRLGVGGVIVNLSGPGMGTILGKFSNELKQDYMYDNFGASKCSNPSAELVGVLFALREFSKFWGPLDKVVIHADYLGVKEWMTEKWRIKEPYIAKIKSEIDKEIMKQGLQGRLSYEWVKGHQKFDGVNPDIYWNNYVDSLAKGID